MRRFRRRTYRRRRPIRRRRFLRGRRRYRRRITWNRPIYRITRITDKGYIFNSTTAPTNNTITFYPNDVSSVTEFSNLFTQYKFNGVQVKFIPRTDIANITTTTTNPQGYGTFYYAFWPLNGNAPPTINVIRELATCRAKYSVSKPWSIFIKPRAAMNVYNGAVASDAYGQLSRGVWLSTDYMTVPFYGLMWWWDQAQFTTSIQLVCKYYFSFRGPK